jgi:hypothetical protein
MSDHDSPPPESAPPESPAASPSPSSSIPPRDERRRRRLEGVIPEIVRRAVELGVEKTLEAPDNVKQLVSDLKLPKEIAHYLLAQIDETKNGLFRVVAKEIRDFLEHTNFAGEVQKLLTTVQFEVNTTIRFTPNDGRSKRAAKKKGKPEGPPQDAESAEAEEREEEDADDADTSAGDADPVTSLPRPEVKTNVHVHRDDRKRNRET